MPLGDGCSIRTVVPATLVAPTNTAAAKIKRVTN
jgi:hypothetical protein